MDSMSHMWYTVPAYMSSMQHMWYTAQAYMTSLQHTWYTAQAYMASMPHMWYTAPGYMVAIHNVHVVQLKSIASVAKPHPEWQSMENQIVPYNAPIPYCNLLCPLLLFTFLSQFNFYCQQSHCYPNNMCTDNRPLGWLAGYCVNGN